MIERFFYDPVPAPEGVVNTELIAAIEEIGKKFPGRGSAFKRGVAALSGTVGFWFSKTQIKNLCRSKKNRYKVSKSAAKVILRVRDSGVCDDCFPVGECFSAHCMSAGYVKIEKALHKKAVKRGSSACSLKRTYDKLSDILVEK